MTDKDMAQPFIVSPGHEQGKIVSMDEYSDAFQFLLDEWQAADTFLENLGYPAKTEDDEVLTMVQRIRMALDHE